MAADVRSPGDVPGLAPGWYYLRLVVDAYHFLVFAVELAGWHLHSGRTRVLGAGRLVRRFGKAAAEPGTRRPAWDVLPYAIGGGISLVRAALTNLDLVGSRRFLLRWWENTLVRHSSSA